jgi:hypothetical protein
MSPLYSPPAAGGGGGGVLIGKAKLAANATDVGPIAIPSGYAMLFVSFFIAGYTASQIAMIRLGTGATVDTGANYSSWRSNLAAAATAGTSEVAQAAQTNGRRGNAIIYNPAGENKAVTIETVCYSAQNPTAASAMASMATVAGAWFNTAQALSISLNSGGAGSLMTNTFLTVYGIPGTT